MGTMEKDISVLHVDTGRDWRGGQRQVLTLHKEMLNRNINSYLLCNKDGLLYENALIDKVKNIFYFKPSLFSLKNQTNKIINSIRPNIVHCHDSKSVLITKKSKNYYIFHTRRVSYPLSLLSVLFKYKKVDVHIAVNPSIKKYLLKFFKTVCFIPSCIDVIRFQKVQTIDNIKKENINILYIGAFTEQKGIDILLNSLPEVIKQEPNLKIHLVGDGHLINGMKQLASKKQLNKNIIFYGRRNDVEKFYLSCDYFVFPSINGEGSSGVIKEALAAGITVISSDLKDNLSLIEDKKTGFLFKNGSHKSLSFVLNKLLNKRIKLNKEKLRKSIEKYHCKTTVSMHIEKYKKYSK